MSKPTKTVPTLERIREKRVEIYSIVQEHGASNIRIVGSVARGQATLQSDVDFLMTLSSGTNVFDLVGLWLDLESLLGYPVNIIPDTIQDETFRKSVLEDAVAL